VKVNVTALMTLRHVEEVVEVLSPAVPAIVSVFAGRIADTGRDPVPIMKRAAEIVRRGHPEASLLWASPREVLNVYQADECGCHIITATKPVLDKLKMCDMDLDALSRETVKMFYTDARAAGYAIG
jgi:transaldolase